MTEREAARAQGAPDPDRAALWAMALSVWWSLVWRWLLFGALLLGVASRWLGIELPGPDGPGNLAGALVGSAVWLLLTRWAVRAALLTPGWVVWRAWWAVVWRHACGGALFTAASLALAVTPGSGADYLLLGVVALPVSVWSAGGVVWTVVWYERWTAAVGGGL